MTRYVEILVNDGHDDWMKLRDTETGEVFLIGLATRETQLAVLRALNAMSEPVEFRALGEIPM